MSKGWISLFTRAYQTHPAIDDMLAICMSGWESIHKAYTANEDTMNLQQEIDALKSQIADLEFTKESAESPANMNRIKATLKERGKTVRSYTGFS